MRTTRRPSVSSAWVCDALGDRLIDVMVNAVQRVKVRTSF
jgi:hypothetical protein